MTFVPFTVAGIPCLLKVTSYIKVSPWRGSPSTCPSSDDYYGYEETEWVLCDRKGYPAKWLEKKLTKLDHDRAEEEISSYFASLRREAP